jgi:hypothetical protein
MQLRAITSCWICLVVATAGAASAGSDRFELGLRGVLMAADGEPANDIPGFGVFGRYRVGDRWSLGFAIDQAEYDFEQPAKLAGIEQDPDVEPIDVLAESTTFSAWIERTFRRPGAPTVWFLGAGLGVASIDVPDAVGPRLDGGVFEIRTEAETEIVVSASGGVRRELGRRWLLEFALRADQHLADWRLADTVSGASARVDDYLALGAHFGVGFRF